MTLDLIPQPRVTAMIDCSPAQGDGREVEGGWETVKSISNFGREERWRFMEFSPEHSG
jgi:hypothetical protein